MSHDDGFKLFTEEQKIKMGYSKREESMYEEMTKRAWERLSQVEKEMWRIRAKENSLNEEMIPSSNQRRFPLPHPPNDAPPPPAPPLPPLPPVSPLSSSDPSLLSYGQPYRNYENPTNYAPTRTFYRTFERAGDVDKQQSKFKFRPRSQRKKDERKDDFRGMEENDSSDEDDFANMGKPVHLVLSEEEVLAEKMMADKYISDRQKVYDSVMKQTNGCLQKIMTLRFLISSVQTFGNVDGICLLAEYSMNEFDLKDGVLDMFSTLVGPWSVEDEIPRNRANFHSNETHGIPLSIRNTEMSKRQVLMEILGRTEPTIAKEQGIRVGLYTESEPEKEIEYSKKSNNITEMKDMIASLCHLTQTLGMNYQGFPTSVDRYILADAFIDGIADCLDGTAKPEAPQWMAELGSHLPQEFCTPWERSGELFCCRHRIDRNSCCAAVTVSRASFIILYALQSLLH